MINAIIINFGHVNCACQKFKQVPLTAPLHVAHTQCGSTQRGGRGERGIEVARVSETTFNYVKQAAGRQAGGRQQYESVASSKTHQCH